MSQSEEPNYNQLYELGEMPTPSQDQDPYLDIYDEISTAGNSSYFMEPLSPAAEEALLISGMFTSLAEVDASMRALGRRRSQLLREVNFLPSPEAVEKELQIQSELRNRDDILSTIGRLGLADSNDYFVIGGANMVLRGIKPATPDLDILVSNELFLQLQSVEGSKIKQPPPSAIARGATNTSVWIKNDAMDVPLSATTSLGDGYYPISFDSHNQYTEYIHRVPCLALSDVIEAKANLQRTKDITDLRLIEKFVGHKIELPPLPTNIDRSLDS